MTSLLEAGRAGRASNTDSELNTVEGEQTCRAGPSSYTSSPFTFGFDQNRDDDPNGAGKTNE